MNMNGYYTNGSKAGCVNLAQWRNNFIHVFLWDYILIHSLIALHFSLFTYLG